MSGFKALSLTEQMAAVQAAILTPVDAYVKEIYPDHAIIEMGGSFWRVGYAVEMTEDGAEKVAVSDYGTWQKVEREWTAAKSATVKAVGDWELDVLGVPFGSPLDRDEDGEYFDATTNLHLDKYGLPAVAYYHGGNDGGMMADSPEYIGKAISAEQRDDGVWYRVALDKASELARRVWEDAQRGLARASSGTIGHLMRKDEDGHIREWPVAELSLFETSTGKRPANQYAVAVPVLKALGFETENNLAETDEAFGALLPKGDRTSPVQNADAETVKALTIELDLLELEAEHEL